MVPSYVLPLALLMLFAGNVNGDCSELAGSDIIGAKWLLEYYEDGNGNLKSRTMEYNTTYQKVFEDGVLVKEYACVSMSKSSSEFKFILSTPDQGNPNTVGMYYCVQFVDLSRQGDSSLLVLTRIVEIGQNPTGDIKTDEPSKCDTLFDYRFSGSGDPTVGPNYFQDFNILVRIDDAGNVVDDSVAEGICPDTIREAYKRNIDETDPDILLSDQYQFGHKIEANEASYTVECDSLQGTATLEGNILDQHSCGTFPSSYFRPLLNNDIKCLRWGQANALKWTYDDFLIVQILNLDRPYFACGRFRQVPNSDCIKYSLDLTDPYKPTCKVTHLDDKTDEAENFANLVDAESVMQLTANVADPRPGYLAFQICSNDCQRKRCQNVATCEQDLGSFECDCPDGFEGNLCELDKNECLDENGDPVCLHDGDCTDQIDDFSCNCNAQPGVPDGVSDGTGWRGETCDEETCYIPDRFRIISWFYKYAVAVDTSNKILLDFADISTITINTNPTETSYDCERDTITNNKIWKGTSKILTGLVGVGKRICQEALYINLAVANQGDPNSGTSTDTIILFRQEPEPAGIVGNPIDPSTCSIDQEIAYSVLMPGSPSFATKTPFTAGVYYHIEWWDENGLMHCENADSNAKVEGNVVKPESVCDKPAQPTGTLPLGDLRVVYFWPSGLMLDPMEVSHGGAILFAITIENENEPTYYCGRYLESGITVDISFNIGNQLISQCYINAGAREGDTTNKTLHIKLTSNKCDQDNPCMNGATCEDFENQNARCICPDGFDEDDCGNNIDECLPKPCFAEGTNQCLDQIDDYECECKAGYGHSSPPAPQICDDKDWCYNEQSPGENLCQNGGICAEKDANDGYKCTCASGWTGTNCEIDINECQSTPCQHGATCTDTDENGLKQLDFFRCICADGFSGIYCQSEFDYCASDPCIHGHCISYKGLGWYCDCDCKDDTCVGDEKNYYGLLCDALDECKKYPNYCLNGGHCIDRLPQNTLCECRPGYIGDQCQTEVSSVCVPNPCKHGGACALAGGVVPDQYTCTCSERRSGPMCEFELLTCEDQPGLCENGGTCNTWTNGSIGYTCDCPNNYIGSRCQTDDRPLLDNIGIALIAILAVLSVCVVIILIWCWCAQQSSTKAQNLA